MGAGRDQATLAPEESRLLRSAAEAFGFDLDPSAEGRIAVHLDLLGTWGPRLRLTGERDRATILRKHVVDSLAVVAALPGEGTVIDLGSGAGFPGLVVACVRPDLDVILIESRRRKASFLGDVARTARLSRVRILNERAESVLAALQHSAALVVSRAVRLDAYLPLAAQLVKPGGRILAMETPRSVASTSSMAQTAGLRVESVREYALPDGEKRSLVILRSE